jgi:hypothetical protein
MLGRAHELVRELHKQALSRMLLLPDISKSPKYAPQTAMSA